MIFQHLLKLSDFMKRRRKEVNMLRAIHRDKVEMAGQPPHKGTQLIGMGLFRIDSINQDVLKGDPPASGSEVVPGRINQLMNGILAARRKNPVSNFIIGGMQGNGQCNRKPLLCQAINCRYDAACGNGHIPIGKVQAVLIVAKVQKSQHLVIVGERFSAAHEDNGMDRKII